MHSFGCDTASSLCLLVQKCLTVVSLNVSLTTMSDGYPSKVIAYKHWIIWIWKLTSNSIYYINVVKWKFKLAENGITEVNNLKFSWHS